jgi:hypothetical protein
MGLHLLVQFSATDLSGRRPGAREESDRKIDDRKIPASLAQENFPVINLSVCFSLSGN